MIRQYFGRLGQGKTTMMIYDAWPYLSDTTGRYRIVTNQPIRITTPKRVFEYKPVERDELIYSFMHDINTLYLLDEIHLLFPSLDKQALSVDVQTRLSYMRKYGNALLYTSQGYNHVNKRIRDLTNEICQVRKTKMNPFWAHVATYYDPEYFDANRIKQQDEKIEKFVIYRRYAWRWTIKSIYRSFETTYTTQTDKMTMEFVQPKDLGVKLDLYNKI